jgi:hypothetical protein
MFGVNLCVIANSQIVKTARRNEDIVIMTLYLFLPQFCKFLVYPRFGLEKRCIDTPLLPRAYCSIRAWRPMPPLEEIADDKPKSLLELV